MISSVLVVCVGNICRSPVGERLLAMACPELRVESAGIGALAGHGPDETATQTAIAAGVGLSGHIARQFTAEIAAPFDLILVMEKGHAEVIRQQVPQMGGKTMLYSQWTGKKDIADPYRKSTEFHALVFEQLQQASAGWAEKLLKA